MTVGLHRSSQQQRLRSFLLGVTKVQAWWLDDSLVEFVDCRDDEPCYVVAGMIGCKHSSAVIAYRDDRIRPISVRRSRDKEAALYEGQRFRQEAR